MGGVNRSLSPGDRGGFRRRRLWHSGLPPLRGLPEQRRFKARRPTLVVSPHLLLISPETRDLVERSCNSRFFLKLAMSGSERPLSALAGDASDSALVLSLSTNTAWSQASGGRRMASLAFLNISFVCCASATSAFATSFAYSCAALNWLADQFWSAGHLRTPKTS